MNELKYGKFQSQREKLHEYFKRMLNFMIERSVKVIINKLIEEIINELSEVIEV